MLLILTDSNDSHTKHAIPKLIEKQIPFFTLNLDVASLLETSIYFENSLWSIKQDQKELNLSEIKCVWNRRTFVELLLEEEYDQSIDFKIWKNEWNKTLLGIYSSLRTLPWLNYWRNSYKAENKYLQMEIAKKVNLKMPKTIVSNDKNHLKRFASRFSSVALKLMHQDFYKETANDYKGFYVNKIDSNDLDIFNDQRENPIVLQEYIAKEFEVRYTVVGEQHFICKIDSQKSKTANIDWRRYDIPHTPHLAIEPPKEVRDSVRYMMQELELDYGAFDFIVNKEKEWVFLEINPNGQFLWIEQLAGLEITDSIIHWFKNKLF